MNAKKTVRGALTGVLSLMLVTQVGCSASLGQLFGPKPPTASGPGGAPLGPVATNGTQKNTSQQGNNSPKQQTNTQQTNTQPTNIAWTDPFVNSVLPAPLGNQVQTPYAPPVTVPYAPPDQQAAAAPAAVTQETNVYTPPNVDANGTALPSETPVATR